MQTLRRAEQRLYARSAHGGNAVPPTDVALSADPSEALSQLVMTAGRQIGSGRAEAAVTRQSYEDVQWEATPLEVSHGIETDAVMSHVAHGVLRPRRDDLDFVDDALHIGSDVYFETLRQLNDVHILDVPSQSWLELQPLGVSVAPRSGHAACAVGNESLAVFGGWRQRECSEMLPCSELMNDLLFLQLAAATPPRWELPPAGGVPPTPRRGHSMTMLPHHGERGALLVFGGVGANWAAAADASGDGVYLNDVHIFDVGNASWSVLRPEGWYPSPRAGHTATLIADGSRIVIFGGLNDQAVLADAHVLDTRRGIWWQLYASGEPPSPRHSHAAALVGGDLLFFGGIPAERGQHAPTYALHTAAWELRTSALLERLFDDEPELNSTCSLRLGSLGSPAQVWSCGPPLRERGRADEGDALNASSSGA